jgi:hypothetical protein
MAWIIEFDPSAEKELDLSAKAIPPKGEGLYPAHGK